MLTVVTQFWDATDASYGFSRGYSALWVERLHRGFQRGLNGIPFRFVCLSEKERTYNEPIEQVRIIGEPGYASCIQGFAVTSGPLILVGLDTVITGDLTPLVDWVTQWHDCIALPRDPYAADNPRLACNGVVLCPAGMGPGIAYRHAAEGGTENDMSWCRQQGHVLLDDILKPDLVQSYKGSVKDCGLGDARIVYFHGNDKPHEIKENWIDDYWI